MSDDYAPDEVELRDCYAMHMSERAGEDYHEAQADAERGIARIKADAWEEGLDAGCDRWMDSREFGDPPVNPYREDET